MYLVSLPNILSILFIANYFCFIFLCNEVFVQAYSNIYRKNSLHASSVIARKYELKMTSTSTSDVTLRGNDYQKSFIQDELRPYAMKLHTRDQAPKEGQQKAQVSRTCTSLH